MPLWRYYYCISKIITKFVKLNLSLDHVLVSCSKLNIIYVDLIGFMIYKPLAGLPGFARDSCSMIMSICAFHFYIIYFHGIPQTFDYILTT